MSRVRSLALVSCLGLCTFFFRNVTSSAGCLQEVDSSPLNSRLSNGFTSRGWTCEFRVMAQKPLFLAKFCWVVIFYIWYLSVPLLSSPFHPQPHPLGVLSNASFIFLSSFPISSFPVLLCGHCKNSSHLPPWLMSSFPVYIHIAALNTQHLLTFPSI